MVQTISGTFQITIDPSDLVFTGPAPPRGKVGQPYSHQFIATDGVPPYQFTLTTATLPDGLTLTSSGLLSGTPALHGISNIEVTVTDSSP